MMYIFITSFVYVLLISCIYFSKEKVNNIDNKLYKILLLLNVFGLLIDIFQYYSIEYELNNLLIVILNKSFLVYVNICVIIIVLFS